MKSASPYPFPGLNPYFESWWFEVHPLLIAHSLGRLQRQLPNGLHASIEHGMTISGTGGCETSTKRPDVTITRLREDTPTLAPPANYVAPVLTKIVAPKPRHLDIRELDGTLITVIEYLSPSNKHAGGSLMYATKRNAIMDAGVNLVEVDLIRKWGLAFTRFDPYNVEEDVVKSLGRQPAHAVMVFRAEIPEQREIYPVHYQNSLPACKVPLRPDDADIWLNLQELAELCHADAAFDQITDFTRDPEPPLFSEDATWLDTYLKAKKLR
ncbi:MAG: DUF4058 family protein [Verrucomicrobiaceae bacterium]|nr:DUF4058 family protein [Verrucomicrobiaceae bacterium]